MTRLILVRHCESTGQHPDADLTQAGKRAAEALSEQLTLLAPDAVYSSPYRRAVATVAPFAKLSGLSISEDPRLRERVLSETPQDDWLEHIRRSYEDIDHRLATGESLREAQARGLAAIADIARAGHRLPVVASHGNLISAMLRVADPAFGFEGWRGLRNPEVFELTLDAGRPTAFRRME
jgi:2,3-bisphosphoglycerate-dependent phosphoglycerate mutase